MSIDDFQVVDVFAGLRNSSPTINAADPITDEALPAQYQNLLTNPGFESGLTGWTPRPAAARRAPIRRRGKAAVTSSPAPTPW